MSTLSSPAALRNRDPILAVLREVLPLRGLVLEVASGTGEHLAHFAAALPSLTFQPSDPSADARASIAAHCAGLANVRPALALDAAGDWPIDRADALLCVNMIHISPWSATEGLFAGAARLLPVGAPLYVYGPFIEAGMILAESNAMFDADLRERDARWGLRDLALVQATAARAGLRLERRIPMPANNLSLVFRRA